MQIRQRLVALHAHRAFAPAWQIAQRLQEQGFQTVFAGGCVRDSLLGHVPKDLDLATAAPPEVIERSFAHTLAVGKAFGTIVVVDGGFHFEVTTFRREGPYLDGRHPSQVSFSAIDEDARRRDFTVNALFYDPTSEELLDFVGGLGDLQARCLRAVGRAEERFAEDHLRLLRAVRFVGQLGFALETETAAAVRALAPRLQSVSAERVLAEMSRLLVAPHFAKGFARLRDLGLTAVIWPEVSGVHTPEFPPFARWENGFAVLMWLAQAQVHCEARLQAWKASRESRRLVRDQLQAAAVLLDPRATRAERLRALGQDTYADTLILAALALEREGAKERLENYVQEYLSVAQPDGTLPPPLVTGQDLLAKGFAPGVRMGEALKALYDAQLEGRVRSKAEALEQIGNV